MRIHSRPKASEPRGIIRGIPCPLFSSPSFGGHLQLNRGSFGNLPHSAITGGTHMRMCTGSTVGGSRFESCAALHPILHDRGDYLLSFFVRLQGKTCPPVESPGGNMEHWCSGNTPAFQAGIAGSNPVCFSSGTHTPVLVIGLLTNSTADSRQRPPSGLAMFPEVIRRSR